MQVVLDMQDPQAGISQLTSHVRSPSLQQQLQADLRQAVQLFRSSLQLNHLHAQLEIVSKQSCPKWHADFVKMRMLCTYAGPGTLCIENRCGQYGCHPYSARHSTACHHQMMHCSMGPACPRHTPAESTAVRYPPKKCFKPACADTLSGS